jgi:hypothetical protein
MLVGRREFKSPSDTELNSHGVPPLGALLSLASARPAAPWRARARIDRASPVLAVVEVVALHGDGVPTVSDLADPALAVPVIRAAAALFWCVVGAWLVARPCAAVAMMMRRLAGRSAAQRPSRADAGAAQRLLASYPRRVVTDAHRPVRASSRSLTPAL